MPLIYQVYNNAAFGLILLVAILVRISPETTAPLLTLGPAIVTSLSAYLGGVACFWVGSHIVAPAALRAIPALVMGTHAEAASELQAALSGQGMPMEAGTIPLAVRCTAALLCAFVFLALWAAALVLRMHRRRSATSK